MYETEKPLLSVSKPQKTHSEVRIGPVAWDSPSSTSKCGSNIKKKNMESLNQCHGRCMAAPHELIQDDH